MGFSEVIQSVSSPPNVFSAAHVTSFRRLRHVKAFEVHATKSRVGLQKVLKKFQV